MTGHPEQNTAQSGISMARFSVESGAANLNIQSVNGTYGKFCGELYGHVPKPRSAFPKSNSYLRGNGEFSNCSMVADNGSFHSLVVPLVPQITNPVNTIVCGETLSAVHGTTSQR